MSIIIAMLSNAQRFQNGSMLLTHFEFTVANLTMGLGGSWMGDRLGTPGATGVGSRLLRGK